jgi:hypothetical protein
LAASFITSCPPGNAPLPFTPFPGLSYDATASCKASKARSKRGLVCRAPKPGQAGGPKGGGYGGNNGGNKPGNIGGYGNGGAPDYPMAPSACEKVAGDSITLTVTGNSTMIPSGSFVTFVSGLVVSSVQGSASGSSVNVAIPEGVSGQTYVFITSAAAADNALDSTTVVAGPAIVEGMLLCLRVRIEALTSCSGPPCPCCEP